MNSTAKFLRGPHTRSLTFRANQPSSLTRTLVLARKLSNLFFRLNAKRAVNAERTIAKGEAAKAEIEGQSKRAAKVIEV